jgi:hypothetical protein
MKTATKAAPKHGDLRVWWIPQIPGKPFLVSVANLVEAALVLDTLAYYDMFQLENSIKPDYCNAGGLSVFDANDDHDGPAGSWVDWYSSDGEDLDYYMGEGFEKFREIADTLSWGDA